MRNRNNKSQMCTSYFSYCLTMFEHKQNPYYNSSDSKLSSTLYFTLSSHCLFPSVPTTDLQGTPRLPPLHPQARGSTCCCCCVWAAGPKKPSHLECNTGEAVSYPPSLPTRPGSLSFKYLLIFKSVIGIWDVFLSVKHSWTWSTGSKALGADRHEVKSHEKHAS